MKNAHYPVSVGPAIKVVLAVAAEFHSGSMVLLDDALKWRMARNLRRKSSARNLAPRASF